MLIYDLSVHLTSQVSAPAGAVLGADHVSSGSSQPYVAHSDSKDPGENSRRPQAGVCGWRWSICFSHVRFQGGYLYAVRFWFIFPVLSLSFVMLIRPTDTSWCIQAGECLVREAAAARVWESLGQQGSHWGTKGRGFVGCLLGSRHCSRRRERSLWQRRVPPPRPPTELTLWWGKADK